MLPGQPTLEAPDGLRQVSLRGKKISSQPLLWYLHPLLVKIRVLFEA